MVGIISTARKISLDEIQTAIDRLKEWGLSAVTGKSIGAMHFQYAGDDELRKEDFQRMLDDESIKAVLFARGGYGTARIIDDIDWRNFLKHPKWLCGFSDITVIHSHLLNIYNIPSAHSMMAVNFNHASDGAIESLRRVLIGESLRYSIPPHTLNRRGSVSGILCGGNLSILYSLIGTASDVDTAGKIVFIEDIDEHLYHLDRMMLSMKRSGKLENIAGLVVGYFNEMKNKDDGNPFGKTAYEIIAEHTYEYNFPVCFGFPAGHEPDNHSLLMGVPCNLEVTVDGSIFNQL